MPGEFSAELKLIQDQRVLDMLAELPVRAQNKIMPQLVRTAGEMATKAILAETPKETGLMRKAVGGSGLKRYTNVLFFTAGIRRGFRTAVGLTKRGKLTRSKASINEETGYRDPAKVINVITTGRKALTATNAKVLFDRLSKRFLGKRVAAAPANPFISRAFQQCAPQITQTVEAQAIDLIEREAVTAGG